MLHRSGRRRRRRWRPADSAVGFVRDRLLDDGPQLVPAYTTDGDPVPEQRPLDLPGYPGAPDVRAGNQVRGQFQLDAFGEALLLFASADRLDALDADGWKAAEVAADAIAQRYDEPDAGIWELAPRRWTHSRLACVAGLRSVAARRPERSADWAGLADRILADVSQDCLHPDGRWQRAPDDPEVDASLLLPALRGAVPADDPRTVATVAGRGRRAGLRRLRVPVPPAARGRCTRPRVRSCSAASTWRWPRTSRATRAAPSAGSSAPAAPSDRRACSPRSSTSCSASCAATCRRHSSTRS